MATLGIDIGCISVKMAVVGDDQDRDLFTQLACGSDLFVEAGLPASEPPAPGAPPILVTLYRRIMGSPIETARKLLGEILEALPPESITGLRATGSGGKLIAAALDASVENEFKAIARAVGTLHPRVSTVFEMGGETSKFILLETDPESGRVGIADYQTNGDCAAGTGSFMDQQASRLLYRIEDVGDIVCGAGKAASIAGRCSVFAKSDMIHAQQKGYQPPEVLKGLCNAVIRNYKGTITKGKNVTGTIVFVGGVAANKGAVDAVREAFELDEDQLVVPRYYAWMGAIGAALIEADEARGGDPFVVDLTGGLGGPTAELPTSEGLSMERVVLLRDRVRPYVFPPSDEPIDAYLGIDVGSVSTNLVVLDAQGELVKEIYLKTDGRPVEVVNKGLAEIWEEMGLRLRILGVGTTGSGRELIGELAGADTVNDEITAHKTGATFIGRKLIDRVPDTIFEIGGQDSKFISLQDGVVVDFAMNEACAAGTGSFLEEQAEKLGVQIKGEFASLALSSTSPARLGERCTVFMERDVNSFQQRGATKQDLVAGLAYSIAYNYLNRVVGGRHIGQTIYFQGGTAYNDSVAAAFSKILDTEIIVPPHNGVVGAIGMALLAREKMAATGAESRFRGWDLEQVDYTIREFTCRGCTNECDIRQFTIGNEKTYWGDKCSDRYRKRAKVEKQPLIEDLLAVRERAVFAYVTGADDLDFSGPIRSGASSKKGTVGLPRAMYTYDRLPFWAVFFRECGFDVLVSGETDKHIREAGIQHSVAEPCFPIRGAHGHVSDLIQRGADYVFLPNLLNEETDHPELESHACPWGQTLPWVMRAAPHLEGYADRFLAPTLHFRRGPEAVKSELRRLMRPLGLGAKSVDAAVDNAYAAQGEFRAILLRAGAEALATLEERNELGIVLIGRPYNIYDPGVNMDIPAKLRTYYGVNIIPIDFLPLWAVETRDVTPNMFWNYGRKILQAAKLVAGRPNLHIIYITNFKCGPDSYIKHFMRGASNEPFLTLQFDEHTNDAGAMTRCEAYLDSKGFLRWWAREGAPSNAAPAAKASH
ncbi:MAG: acyl-CoA dehydratase activase [Thermoleophilia bacterium]|nr:acyl-CoA dehydratase activase [Thermoleophilia bacterium]